MQYLFLESPIWDVPIELQTFWQPIFMLLSEQTILIRLLVEVSSKYIETKILTFVFQLAQGVAQLDRNPNERLQMAGWADKILDAFITGSNYSYLCMNLN